MSSPRILFATPASPFSWKSGVEQRSALFLAGLRKVGRVDVVELVQGAQPSAETLECNGDRWLRVAVVTPKSHARYRPSADLAQRVRQHFGAGPADYDLVAGRHLLGTCQIAPAGGPPVLVDLDDLKYRYSAAAPWSPALVKEWFGKSVSHWFARHQLGRFSAAFFVSTLDQQEHPVARSNVLRNVPWSIPPVRPVATAGPNLLFVGSLWYRPNADGVDWFLGKVWPRVLQAEPKARLNLIGGASPEVRGRWARHPGVEAPGFVDDLASAYASAAAVIAPIHSGGGTNIKVLEALAHGRPCVTTSFSFNPLSDCLQAGRDVLVANDAEAFARHCIAVLRKPQDHESLAASGFAAVSRHFGRAEFIDKVEKMARSLLSPATSPR